MTIVMKRGGLAFVLVAVATLVMPAHAGATPIAVGGTLSPVPAGTVAGTQVITTGVIPYNIGSGAQGSVVENVIADSLNPFGAGDLTFLVQINVTSGDGDVDSVGLSSFDSIALDVVQGVVAGVAATSADRVTPGVINFTLPGLTSASGNTEHFIVRTPATSFVAGTILIGGDNSDNTAESTTLPGFAPALPVPEPASLLLLGTGLVGVGVRLRRKGCQKRN